MRMAILVMPKSKKNVVEEVPALENTLRVRTTAPAADNKANYAVIELLAEHFGVPKSAVHIVRGHTTRKKIVEIG